MSDNSCVVTIHISKPVRVLKLVNHFNCFVDKVMGLESVNWTLEHIILKLLGLWHFKHWWQFSLFVIRWELDVWHTLNRFRAAIKYSSSENSRLFLFFTIVFNIFFTHGPQHVDLCFFKDAPKVTLQDVAWLINGLECKTIGTHWSWY